MKVEMVKNGCEVPHLVGKLIDRKIHKLERMLHRFDATDTSLKAELSHEEAEGRYRLRLSLDVPGGMLVAAGADETMLGACGEAFRVLFESVEELKAAMRKGSPAHAAVTRPRPKAGGESGDRDGGSALAAFYSRMYHRLYNYALREIRFRCYAGATRPGTIVVRDILDEAYASVAEQLGSGYDERWAHRLLYEEIRRHIEANLDPGIGSVSIEAAIEPEDIDEEYQEYYQPDEVVRVEDIVADEGGDDVEKKVEYDDAEAYIDRLLSQLPGSWREAFILVEREGLSLDAVSRNRGKSMRSVLRDYDMARKFLRQRLAEAGFDWKPRVSPERDQEDNHGDEQLLRHSRAG